MDIKAAYAHDFRGVSVLNQLLQHRAKKGNFKVPFRLQRYCESSIPLLMTICRAVTRKRNRLLHISIDFESSAELKESLHAGVFAMYPNASSGHGGNAMEVRLLQEGICQEDVCHIDLDLTTVKLGDSIPCVLMLLISSMPPNSNVSVRQFLERQLHWLFSGSVENSSHHCLYQLPHITNIAKTNTVFPSLDWLLPAPYVTSGESVPLFENQRVQRPDSYPTIPLAAENIKLRINRRSVTNSIAPDLSSAESIRVLTVYHAMTAQPTSKTRREKKYCNYIGTQTNPSEPFSCCWCKYKSVPACQSAGMDLKNIRQAIVMLCHHVRCCHGQNLLYEFAVEEGKRSGKEKRSKKNAISWITLHVKLQRGCLDVIANDDISSTCKDDSLIFSARAEPFIYFGGDQRRRWTKHKLALEQYMRLRVHPYRMQALANTTKTVASDDVESESIAPSKPIRRYYNMHGISLDNIDRTCDRDDDNNLAAVDETWKVVHSHNLIDEFEDVNCGEKHFMKLWNQHVASTTVFADMYMGEATLLFARRYANILKTSNLRRVLLLHLMNMWRLSLITKEIIDQCIATIDNIDVDV